MATQQLATVENVEYTPTQLSIIKNTVAADCTEAEFGLFLEVCRSTGLNPFARQIYAIKRGKMTIQTGIDGYRVLAERTGKYAGQVGPFWCGEDGQWHDVWLSSTAPVACKIGVLRRDFAEPMWAVARTAAYAQATNSLWKTMPDVMIAKCAEALALRKAFPEHISGVYTAEEMEQADNPSTAPASYVEATPAPAQSQQAQSDRFSAPLRDKATLDLLVKLQRFTDADRRAELASAFAAIEAAGQRVTNKTLAAELQARIDEAAELSTLDTGSIGA